MKSFRNLSPAWVHTGAGCVSQLSRTLADLDARRVFIMTTRSLQKQLGPIEALVADRHLASYAGCRQHSPSKTVVEAAALAGGADAIISFGGGSVIDTAKAVAGRIDHPPQIAIATTLSAGEFTPGIGITNETTREKDVAVDLEALPHTVIHDPEMARLTPDPLWLSSGIKALDHAVEALWWNNAHPKNVLGASDAASRLLTWLPKSTSANALEAREQCFLGAWMAIDALFGAGARLSHPVGHQLGAFWNIPHGVTSCIALPACMRALNEVTPLVTERVAPLLGATDGAHAADELTRFLNDLGLPTRLRDTQAEEQELPRVARAIEHEFQVMHREPEVDLEPLLKSMW